MFAQKGFKYRKGQMKLLGRLDNPSDFIQDSKIAAYFRYT